jgi:AraC-like DNA-binding protein
MDSNPPEDVRKPAPGRRVRSARLSEILGAIERQSHDPSLSAITVAQRLGVTSRYVHLLMQDTGRSFAGHVLLKRLAMAATMLRDPSSQARKIAEIAQRAGFTDVSYFSRAFRQRYGMTPTELRDRAMREAAQHG